MTTLQGSTHIALAPKNLEHGLAQVFARFDDMFAEAAHQREYHVAGCRFVLRSDLASYLATTDRALAARPGVGLPACRVVVGIAGKGGVPDLSWQARFFNEREVEAQLAKTRYRLHYFHDKWFWQLFDLETGRGVQIMQAADGAPIWDAGSPLRNIMQWQLARYGRVLLHAGTLAVSGQGVLLAGAGGSGKSGTVLSGVLAGLQTVGDDYVCVSRDDLTARPLFETLKQDAAGLSRLGLMGHPAIPSTTNWQDKYQFYLRDLGVPAIDHIVLGALLLPAVTGDHETRLLPASSKEAFLALAPSGVSQIPGDRPVLYAAAADVARRLPCYHLRLGSDPADVVRSIKQFIQGELG